MNQTISMNSMNADQSDAVHHLTGPCIVIAPPGSGKTFVLVNRIRYLTEYAGIAPQSVLVITFTKAAALQMKERYLSLAGIEETPITFGTFHAVYFKILKTSFSDFDSGDAVLTETQKRKLLDKILDELALEEEERPEIDQLLSEISRMKNCGREAGEYQAVSVDPEMFRTVALRYLKACRLRHKLDFDDMVLLCRKALLENESLLREWQKKYRYILIDEFQDVNRAQYDVIRMLAEPERNMFLVGDDDQSIYGFRGSDPAIMLSVKKDYPGIRKIILKVNYRSGQKIIDAAAGLIRHNQLRYDKKVVSHCNDPGTVQLQKLQTVEEQNDCLIHWIRQWNDYDHTAIIARTNTGLAQYAALLTLHGIPFRIKERIQNPFEHPVIEDIRAYLKLSQGCADRSDFFRIMNQPLRYLSRNAVSAEDFVKGQAAGKGEWPKYLKAAADYYRDKAYMQEILSKFALDLSRIHDFSVFAAVNYIRKGIGYEQELQKKYGKDQEKYEEALQMLNRLQDSTRNFENYREWENWLSEQKARFERILRKEGKTAKEETGISAEDTQQAQRGVILITMHGAKGLEYRNVILPDLNERNVPHKKAFLPKEIEEERRVLYVAMTRAKEHLLLTGVKKPGDQKRELSRFLKEIKTQTTPDADA